MEKKLVEFHDLEGPAVVIAGVPAFSCQGCGATHLSRRVLRRLTRILYKALDAAEASGVEEVRWTFTPTGPPEVGGLGSDVRDILSSLAFRGLVAQERRVFSATRAAVRQAPRHFH